VCLAAGLSAQPSLIEVASIRENTGPEFDYSKEVSFSPGRVTIANTTVEDLVAWAFDVRNPFLRDRLIVGWPRTGIRERKFDVAAKLTTAETLSRAEQRRALLELLTARFGFKAHVAPRPMAVYRLMLARPGVLGPKLKRVEFNCAVMAPSEAPKDAAGKSLCRQGGEAGPDGLSTHGSGEMSTLAWAIGLSYTERPIIDATGLRGFFVWDYSHAMRPALPLTIQRELGLKLEPGTAMVDVVVIDAVQMPTAN
jgi:uncharacterized protein (TIGR03435 family)